VRGNLFQINGKKAEPLVLPEGQGPPVTLSEKVYVPIKEHPDVSTEFGLIGRVTLWLSGGPFALKSGGGNCAERNVGVE